jgi:hypothetical protein
MTVCEKISQSYFLEIHGETYPVASLAEASRKHDALRDASGHGASRWPSAHILDWQGKHVGYISYNGRIWAGWPRDWKVGDTPLYDNR